MYFQSKIFSQDQAQKIPGVHEVKQEGKMKKPSFIKRFFLPFKSMCCARLDGCDCRWFF